MHSFIVFASVLACVVAAPQILYSGLGGLVGAPIAVHGGLTSSQYHAQDELGQYSYGYAGGPSAKSESKDAFGNVRGSYSYVDGHGLQQTVNYVADPVNGFRAAGTNIPVGPSQVAGAVINSAAIPTGGLVHAGPIAAVRSAHIVSPTIHLAGAQVPLDTPEVAQAKAQHFAAHAEALARSG